MTSEDRGSVVNKWVLTVTKQGAIKVQRRRRRPENRECRYTVFRPMGTLWTGHATHATPCINTVYCQDGRVRKRTEEEFYICYTAIKLYKFDGDCKSTTISVIAQI